MFLGSFAAGPWQTNCYLVASDESADVVVIDPGLGAASVVLDHVAKAGVRVVGVLATHGHIDHVASAGDLADAAGVPLWIHPAERELLDESGPIVPGSLQLFKDGGMNLHEPERLELVGDDVAVEVGGLTFRTVEAPGHRPGCLLWCVDDPEHGPIIFTGDVLFAGSIGRTDLAGGDMDAMRHTLRTVIPALGDDAILLPGHGPETTLGAERASNPYLQPSFLGK